jgi:hypothetical protein
MDVRLFVPILALLVGVVVGNDFLAHRGLFSLMPGQGYFDLGHLGPADLAYAKLEEARHSERKEIGIFGNSRALPFSGELIGIGRDKFFNFGMPTQAIFGSFELIRRLDAEGKLPNVIVIFQDNPFVHSFHLPYMTSHRDLRERLIWSAEQGISFGRLIRLLRLELNVPSDQTGAYQADGSWNVSKGRLAERDIVETQVGHVGQFTKDQTNFWRTNDLLNSLGWVYTNLGNLHAKGHAVIVVETLLPWPVYRRTQAQDDAPAARVREFLKDLSARAGILYVDEKEIRDAIGPTDLMWTDPTHPPPELILKSFLVAAERLR